MNVVFGSHPAKTRAAAWWVLHRWYRSKGEHRGEGPFKLEKGVIASFFGSVGAFVPKLAAVLRDHGTLKEVGYYEMVAHLLNSADDATVAAIQAEESAAQDLIQALIEAMRGDYWPNTIEAMIKLLSQVGGHPRWRDRAYDALLSLNKKGNYSYDKALRRMELSAYGIPEELEWKNLPFEFVPPRFRETAPAGQLELKVLPLQLLGDAVSRELHPPERLVVGIVALLVEGQERVVGPVSPAGMAAHLGEQLDHGLDRVGPIVAAHGLDQGLDQILRGAFLGLDRGDRRVVGGVEEVSHHLVVAHFLQRAMVAQDGGQFRHERAHRAEEGGDDALLQLERPLAAMLAL